MIGYGYRKWLSPREQEALTQASTRLIDAFFDEWYLLDRWQEPAITVSTRLVKHLPQHYAPFYTPLFYKKVGVCVVTAAWKLAQPEPIPLASPAEQLAAWAMVEEARGILNGTGAEASTPEAAQIFQVFFQEYVRPTVLSLFDPPQGELDGRNKEYWAALALNNWFRWFSARIPTHPYAGSGADNMRVGRAYKGHIRPAEQRALGTGIDAFIDEIFEGFPAEGDFPLGKAFAYTALGCALPRSYLSRYTLQFLKKFTVCILTVAWKLAQPKHLPLSSVAEELAAHSIITEAKGNFEMEQDTLEEGEPRSSIPPGQAFEPFREHYFEDQDFLYLFDPRYDGVDQSLAGHLLSMSSLAFNDWFRPFGDDPERRAHPYVYSG